MSTLPVKDSKGKKLSEITLGDAFAVGEKGAQALHQAVITYQAHQHQGSASTLGKGAVAGSGKKPWKQKGLGRARAGYRQSPVWRGGGVAFGPHPRKVRKQIPRKAARLAFGRAFGERAAEGCVLVLEDLKLEAPRTREIRDLLKALEIGGKALLILGAPDRNIELAVRNLPDIEVVCAESVNTWQIVRYPQIVITRSGIEKLEQRLA